MKNLVKDLFLRIDRRVLVTIFISIGFAVLGYFAFSDRNPNHVFVTIVSVSEKTDLYTVEAEYPQFDDVPKSFNKKIESSVLSQIVEFKKSMSEIQVDLKKNKKDSDSTYVYRASWIPDQLSRTVISLLLRQYSYSGGAHGIHSTESYTYDMKKKKEVSLADIFSGTPGYLERISQYTMNDIKNQLGSEAVMDMIREGTAPKLENFAVFTLSRDNMITFYFPEYQVAPFASGEQKVSIPISFVKVPSN